jgi:N6-adenosine-specific RNA methylase IME4
MSDVLEFHPASEIFELLEGDEFQSLVESIAKHGLINPIWLHPDGSILDGRNRYRACVEANVEPRYEWWNGEGLAVDFVWALNKERRQLDGNALKIAAGKYAIEHESEARERQLSGLKNVGSSVSNDTNVDYGRSRIEAAEKFGIGEATVARTIKVLKEGDDSLVDAVKSGKVSVSAAAEIATKNKDEQREIVAKGEKEILKAAAEIRSGRAEEKRKELVKTATNPVNIPKGKFSTIVIDPPWDMKKIERDVRPNQVEFEYPTMTEEELVAFGDTINELAAPDTHLFMWTTQKFLSLARDLIEQYGFRYVLLMTWHKSGGFQPVGLPQYNCEFVLYGRRGSPEFINTKSFNCCFEGERREHSRKPVEFYDTIRRVTSEPRIDIFSREAIDGFEQFGNETKKFAQAA